MKRFFLIILICVVLFYCVGCDGYATAKRYPCYKSSYWYCEKLDFAFYYEYHEDGRMKYATYPLHWDGETLNVFVDFIVGSWHIDVDNGDGVTQIEEQILSGTWTYKGDKLILEITKDNLFDGQFQELVFIPMDVN